MQSSDWVLGITTELGHKNCYSVCRWRVWRSTTAQCGGCGALLQCSVLAFFEEVPAVDEHRPHCYNVQATRLIQQGLWDTYRCVCVCIGVTCVCECMWHVCTYMCVHVCEYVKHCVYTCVFVCVLYMYVCEYVSMCVCEWVGGVWVGGVCDMGRRNRSRCNI